MNSIRRSAVLAVGLVALSSSPALAGSGDDGGKQTSVSVTVDVTDARKAACANGKAAWSIDADITIHNTSEGSGKVSKVEYKARYKTPGSDQLFASGTPTDNGGLTPGQRFRPARPRRSLFPSTHPSRATRHPVSWASTSTSRTATRRSSDPTTSCPRGRRCP